VLRSEATSQSSKGEENPAVALAKEGWLRKNSDTAPLTARFFIFWRKFETMISFYQKILQLNRSGCLVKRCLGQLEVAVRSLIMLNRSLIFEYLLQSYIIKQPRKIQ